MVIIAAKSFANSFWGRDDIGYEVLTSKMSNAKKTCEDLKALYNLKATLHDDLGRKLLKHVRMGIGREETGTLRELLDAARKEIELNAQANIDLALKIRNSLELPLENFMLEQKDKRKLVQTTVDKAHRNKQLHSAYVMKAKEKYDSECAKQANLESQLTSILPRDAERVKNKLERCRAEVNTLDNEYQSACLKLTEATAIWNAEWKIACDRYQEMEQMRIEFIRDSFTIYVNTISGISAEEKESLERISQCVEQTNTTHDIDAFIDEQGTGPMIPGKLYIVQQPPVYANFFSENPESIPKYQIAKFAPMSISRESPLTSSKRVNFSQLSDAPPSVPPKSPMNSARKSPIVTIVADDKATEQLLHRRANLYSSSEKIKPKSNASRKGIPVISIPDGDQSDDVEDHAVDPRANVLVNLGGNVFEIDNSEANDVSIDPFSPTKDRRNTRRSSQNQKLGEDFDLSIRDLLQELGVHDKKEVAHDEVKATAKSQANEFSEYPAELQSYGGLQGHEGPYYQYQDSPTQMYIPAGNHHAEPQYFDNSQAQQQTSYYSANPQTEDYANYEQTYAYNPTVTAGYYHAVYTQQAPYSVEKSYYSMPHDPQTHYSYSQPGYTSAPADHHTQYPAQQQWDDRNKHNMPKYYQ